MAEFGELRERLQQVREQLQATASGLAGAREQLRRVEARQQELARVFDAWRASAGRRARAPRGGERARRSRAEAVGRRKRRGGQTRSLVARRVRRVLAIPAPLPRQLNDTTPILLMPVRLETRFKEVQLPGAAAATPQLWVRIYPDDCWVDAFDPRLTESEAAGARAYWIAMWEAGGVEQQERAAWRSLVRSHGAGRAAWIVEQFTPVNLAQKPTKARRGRHRPHDCDRDAALSGRASARGRVLAAGVAGGRRRGEADRRARRAHERCRCCACRADRCPLSARQLRDAARRGHRPAGGYRPGRAGCLRRARHQRAGMVRGARRSRSCRIGSSSSGTERPSRRSSRSDSPCHRP